MSTSNFCPKVLFCTAALVVASSLSAQDPAPAAPLLAEAFSPKYILKTNLVGLGMSSINLNFEVKTSPFTSAGLLTGYKLESTFTVDAVADWSDDQMTYTGEVTPQGVFVNPYFRYYPSGSMTGFYVEGFLRYYSYTFLVPYDYDKNGSTISANLDGTANGFGGGLAIGGQFALAPRLFLDIYGGMGVGSGDIHMETNDPNLDAQDYQNIKRNIEENRDKTDVTILFLDTTIKSIEADANATSAWADINNELFPLMRGGVAIGWAF